MGKEKSSSYSLGKFLNDLNILLYSDKSDKKSIVADMIGHQDEIKNFLEIYIDEDNKTLVENLGHELQNAFVKNPDPETREKYEKLYKGLSQKLIIRFDPRTLNTYRQGFKEEKESKKHLKMSEDDIKFIEDNIGSYETELASIYASVQEFEENKENKKFVKAFKGSFQTFNAQFFDKDIFEKKFKSNSQEYILSQRQYLETKKAELENFKKIFNHIKKEKEEINTLLKNKSEEDQEKILQDFVKTLMKSSNDLSGKNLNKGLLKYLILKRKISLCTNPLELKKYRIRIKKIAKKNNLYEEFPSLDRGDKFSLKERSKAFKKLEEIKRNEKRLISLGKKGREKLVKRAIFAGPEEQEKQLREIDNLLKPQLENKQIITTPSDPASSAQYKDIVNNLNKYALDHKPALYEKIQEQIRESSLSKPIPENGIAANGNNKITIKNAEDNSKRYIPSLKADDIVVDGDVKEFIITRRATNSEGKVATDPEIAITARYVVTGDKVRCASIDLPAVKEVDLCLVHKSTGEIIKIENSSMLKHLNKTDYEIQAHLKNGKRNSDGASKEIFTLCNSAEFLSSYQQTLQPKIGISEIKNPRKRMEPKKIKLRVR